MNVLDNHIFEALFNQVTTPIAIIEANPPDFTVLALNDHYKKNTSTPTEGLIGKSAFEIYKPWNTASREQFNILKKGLVQAIETKQPVNLPTLFFEAAAENGKPNQSWWQIEIMPIIMGNNAVEFLMCKTSNVTKQELTRISVEQAKRKEAQLNAELKEVNEELITTVEELSQSQESLNRLNNELEQRISARTKALKESENRFRSILDALPQIAWTMSLDGGVDFYNQKWYEYTGLNFEDSKGWGWQQVIHPDDIQYGLASINSIINSMEPGEFEIRQRGRDDVYRWHLVRIKPLLNEVGEIIQWIGTATDIDALIKLQHQKDDFISIASHELKTPITSLNASLQLLDRMKNNPSPDMLPKLISQCRRSMQKISTLIDDLLNIGRIKQGNLPLNKTIFTLSELLNACCNPMSLAGKHNFHIVGDKELQVYADEHRIDQVMVNLINNAIKYAPNSADIFLVIEPVFKMVKVSVKDSGPGIPDDKLPHLFDRYYRVNTNNAYTSGLGLGLYISSEIIKRHGGEMGVESELGKGSTFWFTLPRA